MNAGTLDEVMAIYQELDLTRRPELANLALHLVAQQRAEERVREAGALTVEQLRGMTLADVQRHASRIGVPSSAVVRVTEANA